MALLAAPIGTSPVRAEFGATGTQLTVGDVPLDSVATQLSNSRD
jgi:alpha-D-ribose 1-methylphosphonate 5-triphosphate synthase subunit PhnG